MLTLLGCAAAADSTQQCSANYRQMTCVPTIKRSRWTVQPYDSGPSGAGVAAAAGICRCWTAPHGRLAWLTALLPSSAILAVPEHACLAVPDRTDLKQPSCALCISSAVQLISAIPLPVQMSARAAGPPQHLSPQPPAPSRLRPMRQESKVLLLTRPQMLRRRHQQLGGVGHLRTWQPNSQRRTLSRPPLLDPCSPSLLCAWTMLGCSGQAPAWGPAMQQPSSPGPPGVPTWAAPLETQQPRQAPSRRRPALQATLQQEHPWGSAA